MSPLAEGNVEVKIADGFRFSKSKIHLNSHNPSPCLKYSLLHTAPNANTYFLLSSEYALQLGQRNEMLLLLVVLVVIRIGVSNS